jgi:hypothetical protein
MDPMLTEAVKVEETAEVVDKTASLLRVKVYEMTDTGNWDDKGTGHVTCSYMVKPAFPNKTAINANLLLARQIRNGWFASFEFRNPCKN